MAKHGKHWHESDEFETAGRVSDEVLKRSGPLSRVSPNLVTVAGTVLVVPMLWAFMSGRVLVGAILFTLSMMTDWCDGALARYQARVMTPSTLVAERARNPWVRRGPTDLGKILDPLADKIRYFAALYPLGWTRLPHWLVWTALGIAFTLTNYRKFVAWVYDLTPGANKIGKYKVYAEILVVAALVLEAGLDAPFEAPTLILALAATALGGASLLTQVVSVRKQIRERRRRLLLPLIELVKLPPLKDGRP